MNADLELTVGLIVIGSRGKREAVTAVIDTGFSGYLTLPSVVVDRLGLRRAADREVRLGDGTRKVMTFYRAQVEGEGGATERVRVLNVEDAPLIGTALLEDYDLTARIQPGGAVTLTRIATEADESS